MTEPLSVETSQAWCAGLQLEAFIHWHDTRHQTQAPNTWHFTYWSDVDEPHVESRFPQRPRLPSRVYSQIYHFEDGSMLALDSRSGSLHALWWNGEAWTSSAAIYPLGGE